MHGRVGRADVKLMEEPMKSLSELAAIYERWANANEATAEEILSRLDSLPANIQQQQRWRASQVKAEATALKIRAKELRELDSGMVQIVQDGYRVPQDRDQCCDAPQAIWGQKRFR
jgi:Zn-dependent M16 (insulinase) family peptidase